MKDLTWIKNKLIAHRGLHTKDQSVPENSMLAFAKAVENDYGIELDVNVLGDGVVLAFHDINLKRLTGVDKYLYDLSYDNIKDLKLHNTDETIPTLKSVLDFVDGKVPLLIELKPHGDSILLCEQFMKTMKDYKGVYAIHSFSPFVVKWFKKHHPEIIRGQITEYFRNDLKMKRITKFLMKTMLFNCLTKPDFINYGIYDLPNRYCDRLHKKGMCIISYASKSQADFGMVKEHYDNSVFEFFIPKQ